MVYAVPLYEEDCIHNIYTYIYMCVIWWSNACNMINKKDNIILQTISKKIFCWFLTSLSSRSTSVTTPVSGSARRAGDPSSPYRRDPFSGSVASSRYTEAPTGVSSLITWRSIVAVSSGGWLAKHPGKMKKKKHQNLNNYFKLQMIFELNKCEMKISIIMSI